MTLVVCKENIIKCHFEYHILNTFICSKIATNTIFCNSKLVHHNINRSKYTFSESLSKEESCSIFFGTRWKMLTFENIKLDTIVFNTQLTPQLREWRPRAYRPCPVNHDFIFFFIVFQIKQDGGDLQIMCHSQRFRCSLWSNPFKRVLR